MAQKKPSGVGQPLRAVLEWVLIDAVGQQQIQSIVYIKKASLEKGQSPKLWVAFLICIYLSKSKATLQI